MYALDLSSFFHFYLNILSEIFAQRIPKQSHKFPRKTCATEFYLKESYSLQVAGYPQIAASVNFGRVSDCLKGKLTSNRWSTVSVCR